MTATPTAERHDAAGCDTGSNVTRSLLGYGAGMVAAGIFTADPTDGFPPGTPAGQGTVSWHGPLHLASGGVGFLCLVAACMLLARRFARAGERRWAVATAVVGVVFLAAFAGIASGGASRTLVIVFTVAVLVTWTWFSTLHVRLYRDTRR